MFLISSSRFRRAIKGRIFFWQRQNQINPAVLFTAKQRPLEKVDGEIHLRSQNSKQIQHF
jgi:hypothetical protein